MVVTAYYMAHQRWSSDQAIEFVRFRRLAIRPNPSFMKLLSEWERSLETR